MAAEGTGCPEPSAEEGSPEVDTRTADLYGHPLLQSTEELVSQILFSEQQGHGLAGGGGGAAAASRPGLAPAPGTPGRSDALLLAKTVRRAVDAAGQSQGADGFGDEEDEGLDEVPGCGTMPSGARGDARLRPTPPGSGSDLVSVPLNPRAPEPVQMSDESLLEDLAALRPEDPRRRVSETMDGTLLRPRWKKPVAVIAWGCSHNYQLGTGQYVAQATPKIVSPLERLGEDVCDLACGADHCAAVDAAGRLFTWGLSDHGRLGLQAARDAPVPAHVRSLADEHIVSVSCGMYTSACISEDLKLFTWGAGSKGQLGHIDTKDEWLPRLVAGLQGVHIVQVALGFEHSAAMDVDGCLFTWGSGDKGQLGHGDHSSCPSPRRVLLDLAIVSSAAAPSQASSEPPPPPGASADDSTGSVAIAGAGVAAGAEDGGAVRGREAAAGQEQEAVLVRCGAFLTAVLTDHGRVYSWGSSRFGALGHGSKVPTSPAPKLVTSRILERRRFVDLSVGDEHCAAVTSMGNLYTWGQGCFGAVGKPAPDNLSHPPDCRRPHRLPLPQGCRARSVSCGGNYTAFVAADDVVWVLGDDDPTIRPLLLGAPRKPRSDAWNRSGAHYSTGILRTTPLAEDPIIGRRTLSTPPPAPAPTPTPPHPPPGHTDSTPAAAAADAPATGDDVSGATAERAAPAASHGAAAGASAAHPPLRAEAVVCG